MPVGLIAPRITGPVISTQNTLSLDLRSPQVGDLLVAVVVSRPGTRTITPPAGWTTVVNTVGTDSTTTEGVDTGSARLHVSYRVAGAGEPVSQAWTLGGAAGSVVHGVMASYRSGTGAYSVLAGSVARTSDATSWSNAMLAAGDVTAGDCLLPIHAHVGDPATVSGLTATAPGVTVPAALEIAEYATTIGNDSRFVLASSKVQAGTSTGPVTVSGTASVAVSGVAAVVRVREAAGTTRSDTFVTGSAHGAGGATSVPVPYSTHDIGDLLVLTVLVRPSTATITTPAGWTLQGTFTGGGGTFGVDSGNAKVAVFTREVTALLSGTLTVTVSTVTNQATQVWMSTLRKPGGSTAWDVRAVAGSDATAGSAAWATTSTSPVIVTAGDVVLDVFGTNTDAYAYSTPTTVVGGVTQGPGGQLVRRNDGTGNDSGLHAWDRAGVTATGTVTTTSTATGSTATAPMGAGVTIVAGPAAPVTGAGSLTGAVGALAGSGGSPITGEADLTGARGAFTGSGTAGVTGSATVTGARGVVAGSSQVTAQGVMVLTGSPGSLTVTGDVPEVGGATLTGRPGALGGAGTVTAAGAGALTSRPGALVGAGQVAAEAAADLTGAPGTLIASGAPVVSGEGALTGALGDLTGAATEAATGAAAFTGRPGDLVGTLRTPTITVVVTDSPTVVAVTDSL